MLMFLMLVVTADSELVLKFSAGLAVSANLVATVDNVQHIDRLRIQVDTNSFYVNVLPATKGTQSGTFFMVVH